MNRFGVWLGVLCAFVVVTVVLDLQQRTLAHPGRKAVVFASMWAVGEPMQVAYEALFKAFEETHPEYRVEARWDGRWVLPAIRPRVLTRSDVPDILNTDREGFIVIVREGYAERLDLLLDRIPHPDDARKSLREAFHPQWLARGRSDESLLRGSRVAEAPGTYLVPAGAWLYLVYYNRVHYDRLGLSPPRTWSDFMANCRAIAKAGIVPLASSAAYNDYWTDALFASSVGEKQVRHTIEGKGLSFDTDDRYRRVFEAVRSMRQAAWFPAGWETSWSQNVEELWVQGKATHIINGSWVVRGTENFDPDPRVFRLGAFPVPVVEPLNSGARPAVASSIPGYALLGGGKNRGGAIALLRFLSKRSSAERLARVGKEIPAIRGARFPAALRELEPGVDHEWTLIDKSARDYAPKWARFVFMERYRPFFRRVSHAGDTGDVDDFLRSLAQATRDYVSRGGEEGFR